MVDPTITSKIKKLLSAVQFLSAFATTTVIIPSAFFLTKPIGGLTGIDLDWQANAKIFIYQLCRINHNLIHKAELIEKGYILANHRCFFDFSFDPYVTKSAGIGRRAAFRVCTVAYLLGKMENRSISFSRGETSSHQLMDLIRSFFNEKNVKRILFYPEGTRRKYKALSSPADIKSKLRVGLLKRIYENGDLPVQLCISSNKEKVFNEKKLHMKRNVKVNTMISRPIHPKNHGSLESFLDEISRVWYRCYVDTHATPLSGTTTEAPPTR